MSSEAHYTVHVNGCVAAAYKISGSRNCVMDLTCVLLETQDSMRQIHMLNNVLGIRSVQPRPPATPAPASPRPARLTCASDPCDNASTSASLSGMFRMAFIKSGSSQPGCGGCSVSTAIRPNTTTNGHTFGPVSTMQRLGHRMQSDSPMDVIATEALEFVAAWRREDERCAAQEDLIHECLSSRCTVERSEEESRARLEHLLAIVTEQLDRFAIMGEYDKFVVFCMENEPVWRQAAWQLQKENNVRLSTTENIYARFLLEDTAVAEKWRMYQEAADYVVSVSIVEREQRSLAHTKAMARRRRQSASQVVTTTSAPREPRSYRRRGGDTGGSGEAAEALPVARHAASPGLPASASDHEKTAIVTQGVNSVKSMEIDRYCEGWQTMLEHLTNGERGCLSRYNEDSGPAATAAGAAGVAAPLPAKGDGGRRKNKSSVEEPAAPRRHSAKDDNPVSLPPKVAGNAEAKKWSREKENKRTLLPPVKACDVKSRGDKAVPSPSPPLPSKSKSKDELRGHDQSSRENPVQRCLHSTEKAVAARKTKEDPKKKEQRPIAVKAASPKSSDEKHDFRGDKHRRRH